MSIRPARTEDLHVVRGLLASEKLPTDIVEERKGQLSVLEEDGRIRGSGALEIYGEDALLRSVTVAPEWKGKGSGTRIVEHLERKAMAVGVRTIWLLTEGAEGFFLKHGYEKTERSEIINKGILDSAEFTHLCASTAVCMRKKLDTSWTENRKS